VTRPATIYDRIYAVVRRIPRGRVATYGQVAAMVPRCSGARQVGYALHALPATTLVPWHRVVNARGAISLGGDSAVTQMLLLEREGVQLHRDGRLDLDRHRWKPRARPLRHSRPR
jgi:methylated-DNA-protein-cysteine methyltransferase related protein